MVRTTKAQRETLKRKCIEQNWSLSRQNKPLFTYRQFRRTVEAGFGYIIVPCKGNLVGIEPDGYAHT